MHLPLDNWNAARRRGVSKQFTIVLAVNGVIVLVLLALALFVPSASEWISAAAEAEFMGPDLPTTAPTQVARPLEQMRVVRSN